MIIMGIDPGARESGIVLWDTVQSKPRAAKTLENWQVISSLLHGDDFSGGDMLVAIEQIRGYGIVAGDDTFDTCEAVGRFEQAALVRGFKVIKIPRKDIKRHLCGNTTTNDKYVRQALIDRIGEQGTKKTTGPLFGISGHMWAALAVAITAVDRLNGQAKI
jgi:hypothetical protein